MTNRIDANAWSYFEDSKGNLLRSKTGAIGVETEVFMVLLDAWVPTKYQVHPPELHGRFTSDETMEPV